MDTAFKEKSDTAELSFKIDSITCASCVSRVEKALNAVPGVESASVNPATEKATVHAAPTVTFEALSQAVEKAALVQIAEEGRTDRGFGRCSSGSQDSCPDFGRSLPLSAQSVQVELPFANSMHELDATNCDGCGCEAFQAKHGAQSGLDVAVILLDQ